MKLSPNALIEFLRMIHEFSPGKCNTIRLSPEVWGSMIATLPASHLEVKDAMLRGETVEVMGVTLVMDESLDGFDYIHTSFNPVRGGGSGEGCLRRVERV
jgi:myosin-crossreactive antigen